MVNGYIYTRKPSSIKSAAKSILGISQKEKMDDRIRKYEFAKSDVQRENEWRRSKDNDYIYQQEILNKYDNGEFFDKENPENAKKQRNKAEARVDLYDKRKAELKRKETAAGKEASKAIDEYKNTPLGKIDFASARAKGLLESGLDKIKRYLKR